MSSTSRLSQTDWIKAAFRALTRGGPQAIRAETIARDLAVSKGSFYWHFKDVPSFKAAMITHWQQAATDAVIAALEDGNAPATIRLQRLFEFATSDRNAAYGGHLAEAAIRDWARYDNMVARALDNIDQQRINYVIGLFGELGFTQQTARSNANVLYGALIGLAQLSQMDGLNPQLEMQHLLKQMLASSER